MAFSVLMSVYEKEKPEYLRESLESVFTQTLPADEVILIEDGVLTPELYEVIKFYQEKYIQLKTYQFEKNVKLGNALRKGVELCQNELVARMDTDDIALPNRFEMQYNFMQEHSEVSVCGGYIEEFDDDGNIQQLKVMPRTQKEIIKYARLRNPVNHMTVMFRKGEVLKAGNYMDFPFLEDYYLWIRMLGKGAVFQNIPKVLVKARTNPQFYQRRGGRAYCKQYLKLRREQKRLHLLKSWEYVVSCVLTIVMTRQPGRLRKGVYQRILRRGSA